MADDKPPKGLDYWNGASDQQPSRLVVVFSLVPGIFFGVVTVAAVGFSVDASALHDHVDPTSGAICWGAVAVPFAMVVVALIVDARRTPKTRQSGSGRFFLLGLLIGCGITCLLEGLCFSSVIRI